MWKSLLSILLAVPLYAQLPMKPGDVFLLRGTSGNYLSAWPNEDLRMSPNTAAWEQWQFVDEGGGNWRIRSFHGTDMAYALRPSGHHLHAPAFQLTPSVVFYIRAEAAPVREYGKPDVPTDKVRLRPFAGYTDNTLRDLESRGDQWAVVVVPQPAAGRAPRKNGVERYASSLFLRSFHGTYLQNGTSMSSQVLMYAAVHAAQKPANPCRLYVGEYISGSAPILFGETVRYECMGPAALRPRVTPSGTGKLMMHHPGVFSGTSDAWTLIDPTGRYKNGEIVPYGALIALRQDTLHPSADPGIRDVQLSPNSAEWEQWLIVQP